MQTEPVSQADRIMLAELFKDVAAFGRRIRERRGAEAAVLPKGIIFGKPELVSGKNEKPAE